MSQAGGPIDFNTAKPANLTVVDETRLQRLREALQARCADLARVVFPHAVITNAEARVGDLEGNPGESLAISIDKGLWHDHATGEGGDLIDLWRETSRTTFPQAIEDLEHWAGLAHGKKPKWSSAIVKLGEKRKETPVEPRDRTLGAAVQTWHYHSADGAILGKVSKYILANGEKTYRPFNAHGEMKPPDPRPLYRLPAIRTAQTVIFVEGEKCADALASLGFEATSAMQGANTLIEKTDWSPLAGKTVILWPDNDEPGLAFMARVAPILEGLGCTLSYVTPPADKPAKWDAADAVEAGEEISDYLPTLTEKPPAQRFRILTVDELYDIRAPEWRIDGIFPTHGSSTIYGAFESFKSFVALDMALCLSTGLTWQGREAKPCNVLYVAGEGQHGLAHRVFGWCAAKQLESRPAAFRALPEAVAIPHPSDTDALLRSIDSTGLEFGLIVLDTITRMANGGSLNDEKDVQAYVRGSDRLRIATGAHIMHVGHSGKDESKGLMGSIVLPAAMETIMFCERKASSVTLINEHPRGKQKDGAPFPNLRFALKEVHFERGGQDATTLILIPDDDVVLDNGVRKLGKRQQAVIDALTTAEGEPLGWNRIGSMSGISDSGSLGATLTALIDKGLIGKEENDSGASVWFLKWQG